MSSCGNYILQNKTAVIFCILLGTVSHHSIAMPRKKEQNVNKMLKLESLETQNQIHLLGKVCTNGKSQIVNIRGYPRTAVL
jgi:hypothetical protein